MLPIPHPNGLERTRVETVYSPNMFCGGVCGRNDSTLRSPQSEPFVILLLGMRAFYHITDQDWEISVQLNQMFAGFPVSSPRASLARLDLPAPIRYRS